ncbi:MAG: carbohydrate porin [Candidatus Omnitrophica bacterium]|nr:carbohydrate porin [Candidatus Omnitrophota bacterium]MDD5436720.1 carbohydrate porin [Candidatus Omnitrophota bacterium]
MKRLTFIFALILCAAPAYAQDIGTADTSITSNQYFRDLRCAKCKQEKMTGHWQGTRIDLEDKGVTFASSYVADILGNTVGGRMQGARYCHSMGWDANFDLEKFAKLAGTQFHISGIWRAGQNLTSAVIGNAFVVSSIFGHQQFRLYALYLEQALCDNRVNIRVGRIGAGDDFAAAPIYWNFVQNAIDGNPVSIPINLYFPTYPTATWGIRAKCNIIKDIYTISGLYNGDPNVQRDSAYGMDFTLRLKKKGLIFAQEIAYAPNTDKGCKGKGLPGIYKAGFYYHGGTFFDMSSDINGAPYVLTGLPAKKHIGNYNLYFHAEQMIYRKKGTDCDEGLTPFVVVTVGPENMNKFPFFLDGGLVYRGLIPTRKHDISAVGFAYGKYSDDMRHAERDAGAPIQSYEFVVEFTHKIEITPWMFLQPDLQYIVNPSGAHNIDDAFVVGTRFGLTF